MGRRGGGGRRRCQGLQGLLPGQGSAAFGGAKPRSVGLVAPLSDMIKFARKAGHYFCEFLIWQTLALSSCVSLRWHLEEFHAFFHVNVNSDLEVEVALLVQQTLHMAVGG